MPNAALKRRSSTELHAVGEGEKSSLLLVSVQNQNPHSNVAEGATLECGTLFTSLSTSFLFPVLSFRFFLSL
jgi:hypothetical protein